MGLKGYRSYTQHYIDNGEEFREDPIPADFKPTFKNSNTIQVWPIKNGTLTINVERWANGSLEDRSLHEITVDNSSNVNDVDISFDTSYVLEDEAVTFDPANLATPSSENITIGSGGVAYFICTGINSRGSLRLAMRKGSQDNRQTT